jgi:Holliday junction DNA helicase RuvA
MYEFIRGELVELNPTYAVVEYNGIGFIINISLHSYSTLDGKKDVLLFLHQVVREDAHFLYGFVQKEERELFRHLISVSGIGSNTARVILSSLSAAELKDAILQSDVDTLKRIKGIGLKTAQRILVDLKDKLGKVGADQEIFATTNNTIKQEALSALVMLGFAKGVAEKIIAQILKQNPNQTVETLIKEALKGL